MSEEFKFTPRGQRPTAEEARSAADVVERMSIHFDAMVPEMYPWSASALRLEAEHLEAEENR